MTTQEQTQSSCLTVLSRAIDDLQHYVRDVLEFARIESRVVTPSCTVFHLQDLFQRLALQFESVADHRQVPLRLRTTTAKVETDEGVLLRVLENLIGNAIKYTRGGVLVGARRRAGRWCIEVWDQGPGIPPASLNQIFASFYQERVYAGPQQVGFGFRWQSSSASRTGSSTRWKSSRGSAAAACSRCCCRQVPDCDAIESILRLDRGQFRNPLKGSLEP